MYVYLDLTKIMQSSVITILQVKKLRFNETRSLYEYQHTIWQESEQWHAEDQPVIQTTLAAWLYKVPIFFFFFFWASVLYPNLYNSVELFWKLTKIPINGLIYERYLVNDSSSYQSSRENSQSQIVYLESIFKYAILLFHL